MQHIRARRLVLCVVAAATIALPLAAQPNNALLSQAQQMLAQAEAAGAPKYATSLYEEARWRVQFAQANWNSPKPATNEQAEMRADEAAYAARAAIAKARWLSTNAAIRDLQSDITRFGGRSDVVLVEEAPSYAFNRGTTTKDRIAYAQAAIDQAKAAGAQSIPDNDLATAQADLESARKVSRGRDNSDIADHLAFDAEMMARRAWYMAQYQQSVKVLPGVQIQRTQLAQTASERSAEAERLQRQQAEQAAAALQQQLAAEQANRQAQAAELDRLRQQVEETRRAEQARVEADRNARMQAEQQLDAAFVRYQTAVATGTPSDIDAARRAVEDQQIALQVAQARERADEAALDAEISGMRADLEASQRAGNVNAQILSERQAQLINLQTQLDQMRREHQEDINARNALNEQRQALINDAQTKRQQAEAQAQELRQRAEQAQQQAQAAQQQAQAAQQQAQQAQQQMQQMQSQTKEQVQQATQQAQAAQQAAQQAQSDLAKAREEIAARDAEARRLRREADLAKLAATRAEQRGFIVTLPGIFFDTGKSQLKPGARNTLQKIADVLKTDPTIKMSVEGHTDSVGTAEKNLELSEMRANAVREFLVNAGVPADKISATGKGEADPVATNKTAAGRQQNRRVELIIQQ